MTATPQSDVGGARALACVFAHPDDETFSSAATLAGYAAAGVACTVLCATDGDAGRNSGVPVGSREELGRVRRAELHQAAGILGVRHVRSLGLPDGGLPRVDADALVGDMVRFLREQRPQVVITFGPEGGPNSHRDHRVISRLATAAFFLAGLPDAWPDQLEGGALAPHTARRLYYISWDPPAPAAGGNPGGPPHAVPLTARIDARPWADTKRGAFEAHRSQLSLRDTFEALAMTGSECYALAAGEPQPHRVVEDLFAGL